MDTVRRVNSRGSDISLVLTAPVSGDMSDALRTAVRGLAGDLEHARGEARAAAESVASLAASFSDDVGAGTEIHVGLTTDEEDLYLRLQARVNVDPVRTITDGQRLVAEGAIGSTHADRDVDATYFFAQRPWPAA